MILNTTNRPRLGLALATVLLTFQGSSGITRAEGCTIPPRFGPLVREIPQVVGQCLLNPTSDPSTGDIGQVTTNGELLMRGSDGIAQFTDATNGYLTWVAGPDGVVSRSQDERFEWEAPLASPADAGPAQTIDNENDNLNANELANTNTVDASGGNATGGNANAQGGNSSNANTNNVNPVINVNVIMPGAPASSPTPAILPTLTPAAPTAAVPTATITPTNLASPVPAGPSAKTGEWVAWKGSGLFVGPSEIQIARDGTVFVLDDGRIVKLVPTDTCQCWWAVEREFSRAAGTIPEALRSNNSSWDVTTFILDSSNSSLYFSSFSYEVRNSIGILNSTLELTRKPWAGYKIEDSFTSMAVDRYGGVFASVDSFIVKIGPDGKEISRWGSSGDGPGQFIRPHGLAVDSEGNLYVGDPLINRIQVLSASGGRPIAQFGSEGSGPGQFRYPMGMALDAKGNLYVADTENHRIQKLSPSGQFLQQWGNTGPFGTELLPGDKPGQFSSPSGVALDAKGNLYVADTGNHRIQKLTVNP